MKVRVRLFASYRERAGTSQIEMDIPRGATVGRLATEVARRFPDVTQSPESLVIAVNQEYRDHLYGLDDGDEVALIPPVSGGRT